MLEYPSIPVLYTIYIPIGFYNEGHVKTLEDQKKDVFDYTNVIQRNVIKVVRSATVPLNY